MQVDLLFSLVHQWPGGFQHLVAQMGLQVGILLEELFGQLTCLRTLVSGKHRFQPVAGEEDVAGLLNMLQRFEAGGDIRIGLRLTNVGVEQSQQVQCPRFFLSVLGLQQVVEELLLLLEAYMLC